MIRPCKTCGRRLRIKTICIETRKRICKKCCEMHNERCEYHFFCWNRLHS